MGQADRSDATPSVPTLTANRRCTHSRSDHCSTTRTATVTVTRTTRPSAAHSVADRPPAVTDSPPHQCHCSTANGKSTSQRSRFTAAAHTMMAPSRSMMMMMMLLLCAGVQSVTALVPRTSATSPDLRTPHAIMPVIAACICMPIYVASIVLLWRRRTFFPIAGRGAVYLLTLAVVVLVAQMEMITVLVAYPQGIPWSQTMAAGAEENGAPEIGGRAADSRCTALSHFRCWSLCDVK